MLKPRLMKRKKNLFAPQLSFNGYKYTQSLFLSLSLKNNRPGCLFFLRSFYPT